MKRFSMEDLLVVLIMLVVVVNGWGCASQAPPEHFVIDSGFSEAEATVIRDAVGAWCDEAGYCPTEALDADRGRIELVPDLDDRGAAKGSDDAEVVARNNGDTIRVAANRKYDSLEVLWVSVAHEIGHYCTEHTDDGLMAGFQTPDSPMVIDAEAVKAFRAGCSH